MIIQNLILIFWFSHKHNPYIFCKQTFRHSSFYLYLTRIFPDRKYFFLSFDTLFLVLLLFYITLAVQKYSFWPVPISIENKINISSDHSANSPFSDSKVSIHMNSTWKIFFWFNIHVLLKSAFNSYRRLKPTISTVIVYSPLSNKNHSPILLLHFSLLNSIVLILFFFRSPWFHRLHGFAD